MFMTCCCSSWKKKVSSCARLNHYFQWSERKFENSFFLLLKLPSHVKNNSTTTSTSYVTKEIWIIDQSTRTA